MFHTSHMTIVMIVDIVIVNYYHYYNRFNTIDGWWFVFLFFHTMGIIIPTDELIFYRVVETTNQ